LADFHNFLINHVVVKFSRNVPVTDFSESVGRYVAKMRTKFCSSGSLLFGAPCALRCRLRSAESPDETLQRFDDLVKRQRQFGDLLMSTDVKQVPICPGMSFGSIQLPKHTVSDLNNELVSVN